jgi:hypothetical protein
VIAVTSGFYFSAPATAVADIATDAATTATSAAIHVRREIDPKVMARSFPGGRWCAASRFFWRSGGSLTVTERIVPSR